MYFRCQSWYGVLYSESPLGTDVEGKSKVRREGYLGDQAFQTGTTGTAEGTAEGRVLALPAYVKWGGGTLG